jgi:hypothetical protein
MIISFIWFNKLVKSVAANATWALELCAVATSGNRQWWHCQSQWMQLMPSPIAIDTINAIIVRRQSAHERSPSNATRKAMTISLEATRRPCQRMQQRHCEGVVSITTILIPWQRILLQGRQSSQSVHNKRKLQHFANQRRSQRLYAQCNDGNYHHRQHGQCEQQQQLANSNQTTTNNKAIVTCTPCIMRATIAGQAANRVTWQSQWHRFQWQKNKRKRQQQKIPFCWYSKKKRMLVVQCSGPATATSSQVRRAIIISNGFPRQGCLDL